MLSLTQELDRLRGQVEGLEKDLLAETRRREETELRVEEKDAELAGVLARLGECERVSINIIVMYHVKVLYIPVLKTCRFRHP